MSNLSITEQFSDRQGRFQNYDAYDVAVRTQIRAQKHVDLRTFRQSDISRRLTLFDFNLYSMTILDTMTMDDLNSLSTVIRAGENWSAGTVGPQADLRDWNGLSLTLASGANQTESVMPNQPVDISTGLSDTDELSIALPDFPLSSIMTASSFVDLTSNPTGNFSAGPTASLALNASTSTLTSGDSEFRVPRSAITGIDLTKITGIRFRIQATGAATLRVTAIRVLGTDWVYGPVDFDTRYGLLRSTPSRDGNIVDRFDYAQPTLWRSGTLVGFHDPKPINSKMGVSFNTGSMDTGGQISLFFRESNEDFITQLELNGTTMEDLNGNPQPDVGPASFLGRPQTDLDVLDQDELEGSPQTTLEQTVDSVSAHWIRFGIFWGADSHVEIVDSDNNGYVGLGPITLVANTNYLFVTELIDTTARVYIYTLDSAGAIVDTIYDSGRIYDSFLLKRLPGRFGWLIDLADGDAYVDTIQTRGLVFAEYRTRALESLTPVQGLELFAAGSSPHQYFETFGLYNTAAVNASVTPDRTRSTTGESFKVVNPGDASVQGVKSNPLTFDDFENAEIHFDLYVPANTIATPPVAFLQSANGVLVPLIIDRVVPDQWQTHHAVISDLTIQTGVYQLIIVQNTQSLPSTWWVDNVHIYERTLRWQGRVDPDDPWDENDSGWLDFEDNYNRESAGIMFGQRGSKVQVRGQALSAQAFIDKIKVRPRYAELGRLIDPSVVAHFPPVAAFSFTDEGGQVGRFDASASTDATYIINYEWTFGDGQIGYDKIIDHTYAAPGIYSATLVVTDNNGNRNAITQPVTIA